MRTRVIKVYVGGDVTYLPQYKLPFIRALLQRDFGWQYFTRPHLKSNDATKVSFTKLDTAIDYCLRKPNISCNPIVEWDSKTWSKT